MLDKHMWHKAEEETVARVFKKLEIKCQAIFALGVQPWNVVHSWNLWNTLSSLKPTSLSCHGNLSPEDATLLIKPTSYFAVWYVGCH